MKKCVKCDIVFNTEERSRCLYCNSLLLMVEAGTGAAHEDSLSHEGFAAEDSVLSMVIMDRRKVAQDRKYYIIGSYFCTRTLYFMYYFSRFEMKQGKDFRRWLIQPLHIGSFLIIPWVVFDLLDSLAFRFLYNDYCPTCECKFKRISAKGDHDSTECSYNKEYNQIIHDILKGRITHTEDMYREAASAKIAQGKRSAYKDLCTNRTLFSWLLDVVCVWFSISLLILFFVLMVFPVLAVMVNKMEDVSNLDLR